MTSGESRKRANDTERWPCGVCGRGVGRNSIQFTKTPFTRYNRLLNRFDNQFDNRLYRDTGLKCQEWVRSKCTGIKGSMIKVSKSFACRHCTDQQASVDRTSW